MLHASQLSPTTILSILFILSKFPAILSLPDSAGDKAAPSCYPLYRSRKQAFWAGRERFYRASRVEIRFTIPLGVPEKQAAIPASCGAAERLHSGVRGVTGPKG